MSNRQRLRRLDPETRRAIRAVVTCPDCNAEVILRTDTAEVRHDDECPALRQLELQRRTVQAIVVGRPDDIVSLLSEAKCRGLRTRVAASPYTGLHHNERKAS